jgi:UDP-3-O-[3-hydroxymyristoyl] glucosamine N-acyltransferase
MKLRDIARMLHAEVEGDDGLEIRRVAKIEEAGEGDITFVANPKYARFLTSTRASAVIVARTLGSPHRKDERESRVASGSADPKAGAGDGVPPALVRVDDPYASFLFVLQAFNPPQPPLPPGIHSTAVIDPSTQLGRDVRIGANVVVGPQCTIGDGTMISHNVVIGSGVVIGAGTLLYSNVTVREGSRIGARVIIQPGAVIGSDGFGFAPLPDGSYKKIPQLGVVVIEDDVEIGANCTVDRATMGETRIGKGTKLDNLIQVAHNVVIGEHTVMAAQAGISGSTKVGSHCMIGGQVGFTGHIDIADGTKIGAQSGVHRSVTETGTAIFGSPAFPQRQALRIMGAMPQLPDLLATVRELKEEVEELKKKS